MASLILIPTDIFRYNLMPSFLWTRVVLLEALFHRITVPVVRNPRTWRRIPVDITELCVLQNQLVESPNPICLYSTLPYVCWVHVQIRISVGYTRKEQQIAVGCTSAAMQWVERLAYSKSTKRERSKPSGCNPSNLDVFQMTISEINLTEGLLIIAPHITPRFLALLHNKRKCLRHSPVVRLVGPVHKFRQAVAEFAPWVHYWTVAPSSLKSVSNSLCPVLDFSLLLNLSVTVRNTSTKLDVARILHFCPNMTTLSFRILQSGFHIVREVVTDVLHPNLHHLTLEWHCWAPQDQCLTLLDSIADMAPNVSSLTLIVTPFIVRQIFEEHAQKHWNPGVLIALRHVTQLRVGCDAPEVVVKALLLKCPNTTHLAFFAGKFGNHAEQIAKDHPFLLCSLHRQLPTEVDQDMERMSLNGFYTREGELNVNKK